MIKIHQFTAYKLLLIRYEIAFKQSLIKYRHDVLTFK